MILSLSLLLSPPAIAAEVNDDFRSYVDQARFFMKKEWFADAAEQLELAVGTEDGTLDPETWFLLAGVRYQLTELALARIAADRALVNSRTAEQTRQAEEFLGFLDQQFGIVDLIPRRTGLTTKLELELQSILFDPQLKEYFNKLSDRLSDEITLPYPLGLPAGTYQINGDEVVVVAGGLVAHEVVIQARRATGLQLVEVEVSTGVRALFGAAVPAGIPAPQFELSVIQPTGIWVFGAVAAWTIHPIQTREPGLAVAPTGWSGGGRVGLESGGDLIAFRPSLTARYGAVPGIELGCDPAPVLKCAASDNGDALRYVYATGHAAMIGGELALVLRDRTVKNGFGVGLKTSVDGLFGRLPATGDGLSIGTEPARDFEINDNGRSWRAVGLRVHFGVSYAL